MLSGIFSFRLLFVCKHLEKNSLKIKNLFIEKTKVEKHFVEKSQNMKKFGSFIPSKMKSHFEIFPAHILMGNKIRQRWNGRFEVNERTHGYHDVCV